MGFKDWVADAPVGVFGEVTLRKNRIQKTQGFGKEEFPLTGVVARVEDGEALQKRVTMTRLVALGVFALAAQKKSGGESFLTIEGPEFFWTIEVDRKKKNDAMKFVGKIAATVKAFEASNPATD